MKHGRQHGHSDSLSLRRPLRLSDGPLGSPGLRPLRLSAGALAPDSPEVDLLPSPSKEDALLPPEQRRRSRRRSVTSPWTLSREIACASGALDRLLGAISSLAERSSLRTE